MALFNSKAKKDEEVTAEAEVSKTPAKVTSEKLTIPTAATSVLLSARVTEKATDQAGNNVYVFNVDSTANKRQIREAVKSLYKVEPVAVRVVTLPRKSVRHPRRGTYGTTNLVKKAYVQLKQGDVISVM